MGSARLERGGDGSLGDHEVIRSDLAKTIAQASGFRNILVHQYGDVDDQAVVRFLDELDQLDPFVQDVLAWLNRYPG